MIIGARMICETCKSGTYSLENDVTESTKCLFCDNSNSVKSCSKNVLTLSQGNFSIESMNIYFIFIK